MYKSKYQDFCEQCLLAVATLAILVVGFYEINLTAFEDLSLIITFGPRLW